jgi:hypothetical protein
LRTQVLRRPQNIKPLRFKFYQPVGGLLNDGTQSTLDRIMGRLHAVAPSLFRNHGKGFTFHALELRMEGKTFARAVSGLVFLPFRTMCFLMVIDDI